MISVIDYGAGNLRSVVKAFEHSGVSVELISDGDSVAKAERLVLPGVGAYNACMQGLQNIDGMVDALKESVLNKGTPFLGICVGMQLLSSIGREFGDCKGLDFISGEVKPFDLADKSLKVPHMGWNKVSTTSNHPVCNGLNGQDVYFVHSYIFDTENDAHTLATCTYGNPFNAVVGRDNIVATQFHPEKSQAVGLNLIDNFVKWKP